MLDLSKPLRTGAGHAVELVAIVDADSTLIEKLLPIDKTGGRYPGQTLLVRRRRPNGDWTYQWYYANGIFGADRISSYNLENVPPPVVVKAQRDVLKMSDGSIVTMSPGHVHDPLGTIELTVTDGKLTNVEIVE